MPLPSGARRALKPIFSIFIVGCTGFFFFRAFRRNWASVRAHEFHISPVLLLLAVLGTIITVLLATYGWQLGINALSRQGKVTFRQSVAAVNASGLTKYIPGKFWSYALQMYWLDGLGVSKALIVYVNLANLAISMAASVIVGLVCLILAGSSLPLGLALAALVALLLVDVLAVVFSRSLLNTGVTVLNRLLKKDFAHFAITKRLLIELHGVHLLAALSSGAAACFFSLAIGYDLAPRQALLLTSASLVADVAGFLAIIVPGGLGVREGLMYAMLGGAASGSLALVLPVASRLMNMAVDVLLGGLALKLLRTLASQKKERAAALR